MTKKELKTAWESVKPMVEGGALYRDVAVRLTNSIPRPDGKAWTDSDVSNLCVRVGKYRRRHPYNRKETANVPTAKSLATDVLDVMTSTLREPLKIKLVCLLTTSSQ